MAVAAPAAMMEVWLVPKNSTFPITGVQSGVEIVGSWENMLRNDADGDKAAAEKV